MFLGWVSTTTKLPLIYSAPIHTCAIGNGETVKAILRTLARILVDHNCSWSIIFCSSCSSVWICLSLFFSRSFLMSAYRLNKSRLFLSATEKRTRAMSESTMSDFLDRIWWQYTTNALVREYEYQDDDDCIHGVANKRQPPSFFIVPVKIK